MEETHHRLRSEHLGNERSIWVRDPGAQAPAVTAGGPRAPAARSALCRASPGAPSRRQPHWYLSGCDAAAVLYWGAPQAP